MKTSKEGKTVVEDSYMPWCVRRAKLHSESRIKVPSETVNEKERKGENFDEIKKNLKRTTCRNK